MNVYANFTADAAPVPEPEVRSIGGEDLFFPGIAQTAGVVVTERTALQLSALLAVVNVLATDVAVLPLRVYRRRPDGGRDLVDGDPRDDMLSVSPDGESTAMCWRQSWMCHALLYGNGYAEIQRKSRGMPIALHLLSPERTCAERDSAGLLRYKIAGDRALPPENVLHLAGLGFDGLNGFNMIRLLRQAIGVGLAEEGFAADFYANGSEPGGVLESPQRLSGDAQKNLRESWERKHGGQGNRHRVAILEQGTKFVSTTTDPEKSQLIQSRKYQVLDVARPWRVPPQKIGDFSEAHLRNVEASNMDYLTTALMPWLVAIEQQCLLKLFNRAERLAGYYVEHTVSALLRGDIVSRFKAYSQALADGWLNRDEVRAMENKGPIGEGGGGLKFLVQLNQTTLEKIGDESLGPAAGAAGQAGDGAGDDAGDGTGDDVGLAEGTPSGGAGAA
ncbi:unnamed protein product [uncultured bacterium]|nr:unnamed protein product [uncultured bacterium]